MVRIPLARALVLAATLVLGTAAAAHAQEFDVGDRVTVDVNMSSDPAVQSWKSGTITGIQMWQGQVSGIFIRTDDGMEVTSAARFMRPGAPVEPADPSVSATGGASSSPAPVASGSGSGGAAPREPSAGSGGVPAAAATAGVGVGVSSGSNSGGGSRGGATGGRATGGGALETGTYSCWTANGVAGTMRLVIRSGSQYADGNGTTGTYAMDASGAIEWKTGPWGGFYGTRLGPGKIGISSRPGGFSNTVCNRQ